MSKNANVNTVNVDDIDNENFAIYNTIKTDTFEGKLAVLNALNNAVSLTEIKNDAFNVSDCIVLPGVRKGRNGTGDVECFNTYLITTDGPVYFTQSDGVARSIKKILAIFPDLGRSYGKEFLIMRVVETKLANGNTIKNLVIEG